MITDGQSIPLAVSLTGGSRKDVAQLLPLLDKILAVAGAVSRPRRLPDMLFADRAYDHLKYLRLLRQRGIRPAIAEGGQLHGTGRGAFRLVSSGRCAGCTASAACAFAGNDATTSTKCSSDSRSA
ncbi:transposase [Streptomyces griseorubiginosus]|uniref:transposase n=1 Tax=Streptomyces griseorubiginosus TaxID=67304 RepID=UPI003668DE24